MKRITAKRVMGIIVAAATILASCKMPGQTGTPEDGNSSSTKQPTMEEIAKELTEREAFFKKYIAGTGYLPLENDTGDLCPEVDSVPEYNFERIVQPVYSSQIWTLAEVKKSYPDEYEKIKGHEYYDQDGCPFAAHTAAFDSALARIEANAKDNYKKAGALLRMSNGIQTTKEYLVITVCEIKDERVYLYLPCDEDAGWYFYRPLNYNEENSDEETGSGNESSDEESIEGKTYRVSGKNGSLTLASNKTWSYVPHQKGAVPIEDRIWSETTSNVKFSYTYSGFTCEETFKKSGSSLQWEKTDVNGSDSAMSNIMQSVFAQTQGTMTAE